MPIFSLMPTASPRLLPRAGLLLALAAAMAGAQDRPPAPGPIAPTQPRGREPVDTPRPAAPLPLPGVDGVGVPTGNRIAEGKFLPQRQGSLRRAPTGEWIFVFDEVPGQARERPVVLLPNMALARLERAVGAAESDQPAVGVTVSGQVFVFDRREYLLLTTFGLAPPPESAPPPAEAPAAEDAEPPQPAAQGESDVRDLIRSLEVRRGSLTRRTVSAEAQPASSGPGAGEESDEDQTESTAGLIPEGTLLTRQVGRLVRAETGELAFARDNDGDSPGNAPMILLPCRILQRLESMARFNQQERPIELSGRVMAYRGRNFLLPTSYLLPVPTELRPAQ